MRESHSAENDAGLTRCQTCDESGRKGYCALARCYCGHPACEAFASFVDPYALPIGETVTKPKKPARSSWDDRKESTWIDSL